ncbi:MAG TPA: hypothetical protein VGJ79_08915 [Candidatus Dormibacteraeota bacterium]|jgi:hypothetical protein
MKSAAVPCPHCDGVVEERPAAGKPGMVLIRHKGEACAGFIDQTSREGTILRS